MGLPHREKMRSNITGSEPIQGVAPIGVHFWARLEISKAYFI